MEIDALDSDDYIGFNTATLHSPIEIQTWEGRAVQIQSVTQSLVRNNSIHFYTPPETIPLFTKECEWILDEDTDEESDWEIAQSIPFVAVDLKNKTLDEILSERGYGYDQQSQTVMLCGGLKHLAKKFDKKRRKLCHKVTKAYKTGIDFMTEHKKEIFVAESIVPAVVAVIVGGKFILTSGLTATVIAAVINAFKPSEKREGEMASFESCPQKREFSLQKPQNSSGMKPFDPKSIFPAQLVREEPTIHPPYVMIQPLSIPPSPPTPQASVPLFSPQSIIPKEVLPQPISPDFRPPYIDTKTNKTSTPELTTPPIQTPNTSPNFISPQSVIPKELLPQPVSPDFRPPYLLKPKNKSIPELQPEVKPLDPIPQNISKEPNLPTKSNQSVSANVFNIIGEGVNEEQVALLSNGPFTSGNYKIAGIKKDNQLVTLINGFNNTLHEAYENGRHIQDLCPEKLEINLTYNNTHGVLGGLAEVFTVNPFNFAPNTGELLLQSWMEFHEKHKDNPHAKILHFCHSHGCLLTKIILEKAPQEIRERVIVAAFAPAAVVPERLCFKSFNFACETDIVPLLEPLGRFLIDNISGDESLASEMSNYCKEDRNELIFIPRHENDTGSAHGFMSKTYEEAILNIVEDYFDKGGIY